MRYLPLWQPHVPSYPLKKWGMDAELIPPGEMFLFYNPDGIIWHPLAHDIRSGCLIRPLILFKVPWSCLLTRVSDFFQRPSNIFLPLGKQEIMLQWTWRLRAVLRVSSCRPERQADKLQVEQRDMPGRESGTEPQHKNNDLWTWNLVWMIEQGWNEHTAFAGSLKTSYFLLKACKQIEVQTVEASVLCFTL